MPLVSFVNQSLFMETHSRRQKNTSQARSLSLGEMKHGRSQLEVVVRFSILRNSRLLTDVFRWVEIWRWATHRALLAGPLAVGMSSMFVVMVVICRSKKFEKKR